MKLSEDNKCDIAILALVAICITLLFIMSACRTTEGVNTIREVRIVERDTCIITRADSATATALLHCDSAYNVVVDALTIAESKNIGLEARLSQIGTITLPRAEMSVKATKTTIQYIYQYAKRMRITRSPKPKLFIATQASPSSVSVYFGRPSRQ